MSSSLYEYAIIDYLYRLSTSVFLQLQPITLHKYLSDHINFDRVRKNVVVEILKFENINHGNHRIQLGFKDSEVSA
jgi:hypothetical protein